MIGAGMPSKITLKLNKTIGERARRAADAAGYSSLEEFVEHVLEKELVTREEAQSKEELIRQLKGLGYLE
jgi:hypothetical protein